MPSTFGLFHCALERCGYDARVAAGIVLVASGLGAGTLFAATPQPQDAPGIHAALSSGAARERETTRLAQAGNTDTINTTDMPTATIGAGTAGPAPRSTGSGTAAASAEDSDGGPIPQRRFLIEARGDPILSVDGGEAQALAQPADVGKAGAAQAAKPPAPSPRASRPLPRPPGFPLGVLQQINPLNGLHIGGLRIF